MTTDVLIDIGFRAGEEEAVHALRAMTGDWQLEGMLRTYVRSGRVSPRSVRCPTADRELTTVYAGLLSRMVALARSPAGGGSPRAVARPASA